MKTAPERLASIVRLATTDRVTAWNSMIALMPTTLEAQPGIARSVAIRTATATVARASASAETVLAKIRRRTKTISLKTAIALSPWASSDTRFMEETPA